MLFKVFFLNAEKENESHVLITCSLAHSCHIFRLIVSSPAWNISAAEVQKETIWTVYSVIQSYCKDDFNLYYLY